jgi:uncharacterized protein with HEPN domain
MSKRDWKILFEDILDAIEKIERYTFGFDFDGFFENSLVTDAVVRNIEIIGEASKNIPDKIKLDFPEIPWKKLAGIRNRIVREYFGVDLYIIWYIIKNEISPLKDLINKGLNQ